MPRWKNVLKTSEEVHRLKRAAVLREATRIIGRRGYHNTSLDDIAEALQVAKGTLYNYIKDKQEILFECHMMALDIGNHAIAFAEQHGTSGYAKLRLTLKAYLTWMNGAFGGGGIASEVTALRPDDRKSVIVRRDAFEARLVGYIEAGIADGTIRQVDAKMLICTIMGAVNSVQSWYRPKGRLSLEEVADSMIDLLMNGCGAAAGVAYIERPVPPYWPLDAAPRETPLRPRRTKAMTE